MNTWIDVADACGKFVLAVVLAGALGLERQLKGHPAGLRTHILVCLGSTLLMVVSDEIAREWNQTGVHTWLDRGRIAAGVITGVGFLGAGTIINVGNIQRGLTTAAMIWLVAALGIAIGAGYQLIAVCATAFALVTVRGLEYVERLLPAYERLSLTVRMPKGLEKLQEIEETIRQKGFHVVTSRLRINADEKYVDMTFELTASAGPEIEELAGSLQERFPSAEKITFER
jgi:putative Mg2+ transporter-C (MgtC) family protein